MAKNKKIKILLVGVGDLRNYGCEAIVQGTYVMFQKYWPECELIIAVADPKESKKLFPDIGITFISDRKRFTPHRIIKGVLRRFFRIGKGSAVRLDQSLSRRGNVFLSCGGDNFCETSEGSIHLLLRDLISIGEKAVKKNKFYALWGASVGPFKTKENKLLVQQNIQKMNAVLVREQMTYDYVASLEINKENLFLIADPAFCMLPIEYPVSRKKDDIIIGLNISRLALTEKLFPLFNELLQISNSIKILCIPHVMTDNGGPQDDYSFLLKFISQFPQQEKISILPSDLGAQRTKGAITQCDLLIASRMHACVAGISVATPTLFITYSNKGKGMAQYAYGHQNYVLDRDDLDSMKLILLTKQMLDERDLIKINLQSRKNKFVKDAEQAVIILKQQYIKAK